MSARVLFASTNPGKIREVRQVLEPLGFQVAGLASVKTKLTEPEEDGDTFEANARIKAVAYARATGTACLADDSGLEVDALGGAPGVHSARYAGTDGTRAERDERNNEKLLKELHLRPDAPRTARFVCALCFAQSDGTVLGESRGTFEGEITFEPRGTNGFGYDPLLLVPELGRTSAELSPDEKNARSHRGAALRALIDKLNPMQ
jgi:XTP/dITP diphosphohydrolase